MANRLERLPVCGWHRTLCALLIGAFMFEFIDLYTFAFSAPALVVHLGFTVPDIGTITAAAAIGSFVGAFVGGWAAGRIGRKPTLVACLVMFFVPSLLNALVSTPEWFIALRFLTGIGYQGTTVVGGILLSELVPGHVRGRAFAWVNAIGGLGPALLAWLAFAVVPQFTWGWRVLYLVGGLGLLLVVPFLRRLPESPRWLESRGATDRARATTAQIEAAVRTEGHIIPEGRHRSHRAVRGHDDGATERTRCPLPAGFRTAVRRHLRPLDPRCGRILRVHSLAVHPAEAQGLHHQRGSLHHRRHHHGRHDRTPC